MSNTIQANRKVPQVTANLVPLHIQYSGPANTKDYFSPSKINVLDSDKEASIAYFRGCKLVGNKIDFKDNYSGYIINKSETITRTEDDYDEYNDNGLDNNIKTIDTYTPVAQFHDLTIYGHDAPTESNNQWALINEWKEISDIIHS